MSQFEVYTDTMWLKLHAGVSRMWTQIERECSVWAR